MARHLRIFAWVLAGVFVLSAGLFLYLRNTDLSVYKEEIEGYLSRTSGHQVNVDGPFELHFGSLTQLTAEKIRISRNDGQPDDELMSVGHLSMTIDLWSLLMTPIIIEDFEISDVNIRVERKADAKSNREPGRSNEATTREKGFDPTLIAFRKAQVRNVHFSLVGFERPRPLNVSIEHLAINPDSSDILNLDLRGEINEFPLLAEGKIGPWQNLLDGRDLTIDLDIRLGELHLTTKGMIADLVTLADVDVSLEIQGPAIERVTDVLGFPKFAEGAFKVDGSIHKIDDDNQIRLSGNVGAIDVFASGQLDRLINPERAQLDFKYSGPDTMRAAEIFGIKGAPDESFQISGKVTQEKSRFEFSDTRAQVGDNALTINGWIDTKNKVPDGNISVAASGPDLSIIVPFTGLTGVPAEAFEIDGRIQRNGSSVEFDDVKISVGKNKITANGSIGGQGSTDTEITFSASGPDLSILQPMTGLNGIPQKPFTVSAHIRPADSGIKLQDATGVFGDNRVEANGLIGTKSGWTGTDLHIQMSGNDLESVSLLSKAPYLPAGPFTAAGHVQIDDDLLNVSEATAETEGFSASAKGTVGLGANSGQIKLTVSATSPNLADLLQFEFLERLAGEEFQFDGIVGHKTGMFELESAHASIGSMNADIDGTFTSDGSEANVTLKLTAPDASVLSELSGYSDLPGGAVSVSGQFKKTLTGYELDQVEFRIGDQLLSADGTLSSRPLQNDSDLRFSVSGPTLQQLGLPFGVRNLPAKSFTVSGDVSGVPTGFAIENLDAKLGDDTLAGQFKVDLRGKPELSGVLSSSFIDATDPLSEITEQAEVPSGDQDEFLISSKPFQFDWLQLFNLDIELNIGRLIIRTLDFRKFETDLQLSDGVLDIKHISAHDGNGKLSGNVHLEPSGGVYEFDGSLNIDGVHLGLKPIGDLDRSELPPVNGHLELRGKGNSAHEIISTSNGIISFTQGAGRTTDLAFFSRLRGLFAQVIKPDDPLLAKTPYVSLECAFYEATITNGAAKIEQLAMQSDRLVVVAQGTLNLANEVLSLSIRVKHRTGLGVSITNVADSFVKLGGTLRKPQVQLSAAGSVTTAGAAVATGGLSLLAKSLWGRASSSGSICNVD